MAGYNRGIVATRKLNKENKARLGRRGADGVKDTKIRKVDNRKSHVNALEAYLIDVNGKAGEEYAKRVGAGTINPFTGMPEYHPPGNVGHDTGDNAGRPHTHEKYEDDGGNFRYSTTYTDAGGGDENQIAPRSYAELSNVTGEQLTEFDPRLGTEDVPYFQDIFSDEPFEFLEEAQALATDRAGDIRGFQERGLQSAYGATMGALGSQEATLGRTAGRGLRGAGGARDIAASRSGLATSGTITQSYETQKKDLFQDYTAGIKDIGRQRGTALEQLTLGKEEAAATEQATISGADLDFRTGTYTEQRRQMDEYWEMIGLRQAVA